MARKGSFWRDFTFFLDAHRMQIELHIKSRNRVPYPGRENISVYYFYIFFPWFNWNRVTFDKHTYIVTYKIQDIFFMITGQISLFVDTSLCLFFVEKPLFFLILWVINFLVLYNGSSKSNKFENVLDNLMRNSLLGTVNNISNNQTLALLFVVRSKF